MPKFARGFLRGASHAGEFFVEAKIRGPCDRGLAGVFLANLHARARLDRLVQAVAPRAIRAEPSGEFIDDHDLAFPHDVMHVALELMPRLERVLDVSRPQPAKLRRRLIREQLKRALLAGIRELQPPRAAFAEKIRAGLQLRGDLRGESIDLGRAARRFRAGRDDERAARFVDEHAVRLVDDGESVSALDDVRLRHRVAEQHFVKARRRAPGGAQGELVAQVVEAEFRADAISHIALVSRAFCRIRRALDQQPGGEPELRERRLRELEIARRQIRIHRRHMRAASAQREAKRGQQGDERLPLARGHLREPAIRKREAGEELHIVGREPVRAPHGLRDQRDRIGVKFPALAPHRFAQHIGPLAQPRIRRFAERVASFPAPREGRCVMIRGGFRSGRREEIVEAEHRVRDIRGTLI